MPQQPAAAPQSSDRLSILESEVAQLREEVAELRRRLDAVLAAPVTRFGDAETACLRARLSKDNALPSRDREGAGFKITETG